MTARIYQRPKSPTQSGRARSGQWLLEFEATQRKRHDPLTGWIGAGDTQDQVLLAFNSCEEAVDYARREGLAYRILPGSERTLKIQSYADNFK